MTPKKDRYFIVNRMLNFALRCTGKGQSAAKKCTSLMNLHTPISFQHWRKHTKALSDVTEVLLEKNLQIEVLNCKTFLRDTGQIEYLDDQQLTKTAIETNVSIDSPWKTRGWTSKDGIADVCFDQTGKVLDVIYKTSNCQQCYS